MSEQAILPATTVQMLAPPTTSTDTSEHNPNLVTTIKAVQLLSITNDGSLQIISEIDKKLDSYFQGKIFKVHNQINIDEGENTGSVPAFNAEPEAGGAQVYSIFSDSSVFESAVITNYEHLKKNTVAGHIVSCDSPSITGRVVMVVPRYDLNQQGEPRALYRILQGDGNFTVDQKIKISGCDDEENNGIFIVDQIITKNTAGTDYIELLVADKSQVGFQIGTAHFQGVSTITSTFTSTAISRQVDSSTNQPSSPVSTTMSTATATVS